jgi:hypothetical protein
VDLHRPARGVGGHAAAVAGAALGHGLGVGHGGDDTGRPTPSARSGVRASRPPGGLRVRRRAPAPAVSAASSGAAGRRPRRAPRTRPDQSQVTPYRRETSAQAPRRARPPARGRGAACRGGRPPR